MTVYQASTVSATVSMISEEFEFSLTATTATTATASAATPTRRALVLLKTDFFGRMVTLSVDSVMIFPFIGGLIIGDVNSARRLSFNKRDDSHKCGFICK
jgi:hypothetical protein